MPVLTLVDTLGIQSFVFATNRLRDAVGGSALVEQLPDWLAQACPEGEKLLAAGGNALLRFADETTAKQAMTRFSRLAYQEAPGLEFVAVHRSYQPGGLAEAARLVQVQDAPRAKRERLPGVPLLGLSVTAPCRETRLPATELDQDGQPIARGVKKRRAPELAQRWNHLLPSGAEQFRRDGGPPLRLRFPTEVDHLGRSRDERSLLGVVHVDGNGVGRKIGAWLAEQAKQAAPDDAVRDGYRTVSAALEELSRRAFAAIVQRTAAAIHFDPRSGYEIAGSLPGRRFPLLAPPGEGVLNLPLRPLILGGDDLTFVCDGRLALDLAAAALAVFEKATLPILGPVSACAGVAITRTHAPILRVYEMADNLCRSAKKRARETGQEACALDWHIGFTSPTESLEVTRRRQYTAADRCLTCRPYLLGAPGQPQTWRWLTDALLGQDGSGFHGPFWSEHRGRLKELRDLARDGPGAVQRALTAWKVTTPDLPWPPQLPESGYFDRRTPLLDALELLDIHWPLGGDAHEKA
jgi:hypothetical protein